MAGEGVTHLDEGRPMVVRQPESKFTLANFLRSQLYATMATLKLGMDILAGEHVAIDSLDRPRRPVQDAYRRPEVHGRGLPCAGHVHAVGRRGRPYGMALLASYLVQGKTARRSSSIWD